MFVDANHIGQALGKLRKLNDEQLEKLLPTHGFGASAIGLLRGDDPKRLIEARQATLIKGEREFMNREGVRQPTERTAAAVADSEASEGE